MLENLDVVEILGLGVIGLGFLLALLSFFLLYKQIDVGTDPTLERPHSPIYMFLLFSVFLIAIGFLAQ
ncbi:MAG: hypothetical protein C0462_04730 [Alcanivorax sp.]|nr:hypothetical protein [Alcanivorax sp.]